MNALVNSLENATSVITHELHRRLAGLAKDERGVSAVEFAMLLPLMLTLYLGAVEVSQGIAADRKVTLTARTVADLVSQAQQKVDNSYMTNSLNAATAVMAPYPSSNLKVVVSSVKIDAEGKATIDWSDTLNGTARAKGSTVTLPAALNIPNSSLIWSEVQYNYTPVIGYVITGSMNLKDQIYMRPRMSDFLDRTAT
jgi:Flp pilus assembly protein TadG